MKKETLIKRIIAKKTKKRISYGMALDVLLGKLIRPSNTELRRGWGYYVNCKKNEVIDFLKLLKIDYVEGNDAPRGGANGNFIKLSKKGMSQTREYRQWINMDEIQKRRCTTIDQILN